MSIGLRVCTVFIWAYAAAYLAALAMLAIGTWGLFGVERDPLSGIFLLPLGLPWTLLLDGGEMQGRGPDGPWLAITAPLANLLLFGMLRRRFLDY